MKLDCWRRHPEEFEMLKDTFSQFQPDLWQVDGLVIVPKRKAIPTASKRKAEKWKTATQIAAVTFAITSLLSTHASLLPARSGAISNIIVKVESRSSTLAISSA